MAMTECPECGVEVSEKAETCPKCAYPIAMFTPNEVQAVEQTGKKVKLQILFSILMIVLGITIFILQLNREEQIQDTIVLGLLLVFIGSIWLLAVRFFSWWYHGR